MIDQRAWRTSRAEGVPELPARPLRFGDGERCGAAQEPEPAEEDVGPIPSTRGAQR